MASPFGRCFTGNGGPLSRAADFRRQALNIADRPAAARVATAKTADLTVVGGAGHVGIPLVLSFAAKGLTVNINDINEQTLATLKAGRVPFIENDAQPLLTKELRLHALIRDVKEKGGRI